MSKLKSILKFVTRRRRAMDPELEQSILRVSIVSIMVIYLAARQFVDPTRMAATLNPQGWLFLGGTESLPADVRGLELQRLNRTMVYRKV